MSDEKYIRLLRHPCAKGLSDEAIHEIANASTLIEVDTDEYLHRAENPATFLYLVIQGRLKTSFIDIRGDELIQRFITTGNQFGALAAAQVEPVPINVVATEPSKLLRLDYKQAIGFGSKYPTFQLNLLQTIGQELSRTLFVDRVHEKPPVVAVIHQTTASRILTRKLLSRMVELEDSACIVSDTPDWKSIPGVEFRAMYDGDQLISFEETRRLLMKWVDRGRMFIELSNDADFEWLSRVVSFCDRVLWCVGCDNYRGAMKTMKTLQDKVESCAKKSALFGCSTEASALPRKLPS